MPELSLPRHGRILVIEPMTSAVGLLRVANHLGWETVVASYDRDDRRLPDPLRGQVGEIAVVDPNDEAALVERVRKLHAEREIAAVLPGIEFYVATAARIANLLGLPGHPADSACALRDKSLMRERVRAAGLRVPRFATATTRADLRDAAARVGFPAVIKPIASAGSIHVSRVDNLAQAERAYQAMLADPRPDDVGQHLDGSVLLEQYLGGTELSVEGYVVDGAVVVLSVTEKFLSDEPHFIETGHITQCDLDPGVRSTVEAYVARVCRALRVTMGPFHCELRLVDSEPVLIEMGARLAGGRIADLIEWVTGVSLTRVMLAAHLGIRPERLDALGSPQAKYAGIHHFTAPGLARISEIHGIEQIKALPYVRETEFYLRPGDEVPPFGDFRSRLGHAMFVADSYPDAVARRAQIESMVRYA